MRWSMPTRGSGRCIATRRTFAGFLKRYCAALAGEDTSSMARLAEIANGTATRVAEPLFVLALETGRVELLLKCARGTWMESEYDELAELSHGWEGDAERFLRTVDVPERYSRVLDAFHAGDDLASSDARLKELYRKKTSESLAVTGKSVYQVCREARVCTSNAYPFLAGNLSRVSLDAARRLAAAAG